MSRPRVVFMGTPEFAVPALRATAAVCEVVAVVTQPDRPQGRGLEARASAVAVAAGALGLPVLKRADMRAAAVRDELSALAPDLVAVVAFGAILSPDLLRVPRLGCINLHGSLLPEYRGASPVQQALWDGRAGTGVTTLWMDSGIDTGEMILQRWQPILPDDDAGTLAERLAAAGAPLLAESLTSAHAGTAPRAPQPAAGASYARKLTKADGAVDWTLEVEAVWNHQRAVTPWPGASARFRSQAVRLERTAPHHRLPAGASPGTITELADSGVVVACGRGALRIERLRPEGRYSVPALDWARGARLAPGEGFVAGAEAHA